jgi:hypothetical protein
MYLCIAFPHFKVNFLKRYKIIFEPRKAGSVASRIPSKPAINSWSKAYSELSVLEKVIMDICVE